MFLSTVLHRLFKSEQGEAQPQIKILPLPCPLHGSVLVPEPKGNGEFQFYCSLCRLACQPSVSQPETEKPLFDEVPEWLVRPQVTCQQVLPTIEPITLKSRQEGATKALRSGSLLHMRNTRNRFIERLSANAKNRKLVLPNPKFLNSGKADHDLLFSDSPTELAIPIFTKALPDVG